MFLFVKMITLRTAVSLLDSAIFLLYSIIHVRHVFLLRDGFKSTVLCSCYGVIFRLKQLGFAIEKHSTVDNAEY